MFRLFRKTVVNFSKAHIKPNEIEDYMKCMKAWPFLWILLLATSDAVAISINEIMYNPAGDDNNKEFIEVLLDAPMNLSGFIIADRATNDTLIPLRMADSRYALIVEEGFNLTGIDLAGIDVSVYSAGSTIGNNLDNGGDAVLLRASNGSLLTAASYDGSLANGDGKSVEFVEGIAYASLELGGTPGWENSVRAMPANVSLNVSVDNASEVPSNESPDEPPADEQEPPEQPDECQPQLAISTPKDTYQNKEQIAMTFLLNHTGAFIIEYGIEDLFGNAVKPYLNTTNLRTKTFTPRIAEQDKVLVIKAMLHVSCTDVIMQAEKQVIVLNPNAALPQERRDPAPDASSPDPQGEASQEQDAEKPKRTRIEYQLLDLPATVGDDSEFTARLLIDNSQQAHEFEVWSYVYRGPKSYSGEREDNLRRVKVDAGESTIIELQNVVEAPPGAYKYKVKIRKDGQSTTTDLTRELALTANASTQEGGSLTMESNTSVIQPALAASLAIAQQQPSVEPHQTPQSKNPVQAVFEGKGERLKEGIPYFLIAALALIVLVFVWKS